MEQNVKVSGVIFITTELSTYHWWGADLAEADVVKLETMRWEQGHRL